MRCAECEGRCPDLNVGNREAWELLQMGATQLRVAGMGGTVGFDYTALKLLAEDAGIRTSPAMWRKVRAVEDVIRRQELARSRERDAGRAVSRPGRGGIRRR